ncbi:hypothetical protein EUGRSUZ_D00555 [Eucalyptus grandis]|uniref:Uncharacterized protein n=2 Tax=Eucalyptus grandis TaxID=71139 RepID=A0ACC3L3A1_EUCGR|nr:hypothetical protein EUGRSUZ_D00555 [Eucalyptus grandis]
MWLRSSTMPYTGARRTDNHLNEFAVKPQPKFLNEALQQTHGKQQEQHEPEERVEGVVEKQPRERKHRCQTGEVEEEARCSITRKSRAARRWIETMQVRSMAS